MDLKEAKVRIIERTREILMLGLCKGEYAVRDGRSTMWWDPTADKHCFSGALRLACREFEQEHVVEHGQDPTWDEPLAGILWEALDDVCPGGNIVKFNDAPETTLEMIINVIDELLVKLRAK